MTKFKVGDKIKLGRDVLAFDLKAGDILTVKEMYESFGQKRYKFHETAFLFSVGSNIENTATLVESHTPIYKEVVTKVIETGRYGANEYVHVGRDFQQNDGGISLFIPNDIYAKSEIKDMIDVLQQIYEVM